MSPTFTVVVPVHNESRDIGRTCDALLQMKPEPEIIFVDDGSTDDTVDVLRRYLRRPSMKLLRQPTSTARMLVRHRT